MDGTRTTFGDNFADKADKTLIALEMAKNLEHEMF